MLGLDLELLNLSPSDVIEKFRKDIEAEVKEPVSTFTVFHKKGVNEIVIKTPNHQKIIKGSMISFMISKLLKMKFGIGSHFETIELVHDPEKNIIVMKTDKGIETKTI